MSRYNSHRPYDSPRNEVITKRGRRSNALHVKYIKISPCHIWILDRTHLRLKGMPSTHGEIATVNIAEHMIAPDEVRTEGRVACCQLFACRAGRRCGEEREGCGFYATEPAGDAIECLRRRCTKTPKRSRSGHRQFAYRHGPIDPTLLSLDPGTRRSPQSEHHGDSRTQDNGMVSISKAA